MFATALPLGRRILAAMLVTGIGLAAKPLLAREWHFDVAVDGIGIGTHDIVVRQSGDDRTVTSEMNFGKLGITVYRQQTEESWKGDCLTRIESRTEEHGHETTVSGRQEGDIFHIEGPNPRQLQGCVMSFAYWNPRVLQQSHLINTQSGAWTTVSMRELGHDVIDVGGRSVQATRFAIDTERNAIEVWYSPGGEWVGLKSTTKDGGHVLAYRLR